MSDKIDSFHLFPSKNPKSAFQPQRDGKIHLLNVTWARRNEEAKKQVSRSASEAPQGSFVSYYSEYKALMDLYQAGLACGSAPRPISTVVV